MAQAIAKEPKTTIVAHAPVPFKRTLEVVARMQKTSISQVVLAALNDHFAKLGVAP
jgi:hypothetical protein